MISSLSSGVTTLCLLLLGLSTSSAQRDEFSFTLLKTKNKEQQSLLSPSSYKSPSFYKKDRTLKHHYADDDGGRHTQEPSNENATNGPAENISTMPSQHPSKTPSILPSSSPSFHPSQHPSRKPSIYPTQSPTTSFAPTIPNPCGRYNEYNFGIINWGNDDNILVVNYNYDVETDMEIANAMGITLTDETKAIEAALLDLLIQLYFPQCSTSKRRQQRGLRGNLISSYNATSSRSVIVDDHDTTELIGISSKPIDWTNGDTCVPQTYGDSMSCNIMEGRLSLFYSQPLNSTLSSGRFLQEPIRRLNNEEDTMLHSIKTIMDDGALNDCHPAVISVRFRNQSTTELGGNNDDDFEITNDDETGTTLISNSIMWLAIGLSISTLMLLVGVRYRYHRHQKTMYKESQVGPGGDSSDDEFVEYEDPNWKDSNRVVVSSFKMHRTQSGLSSPNKKSGVKTHSQHTYPQRERQYVAGNTSTHNRNVASSLTMQRNQSNQNSSPNKKLDIRTQLVQPSPKWNLAENATDLPGQFSSNTNNFKESHLIETIRDETNQIRAKLEATRRSMRDLEEQHDNLRQYLELAKQAPSAESMKRARLAMLLMNPSTNAANDFKE